MKPKVVQCRSVSVSTGNGSSLRDLYVLAFFQLRMLTRVLSFEHSGRTELPQAVSWYTWSPKKGCCCWLTLQRPERDSSAQVLLSHWKIFQPFVLVMSCSRLNPVNSQKRQSKPPRNIYPQQKHLFFFQCAQFVLSPGLSISAVLPVVFSKL